MGKCKIFLVLLAAVVGVSLYFCSCLFKEPEVPKVPAYRWWGPGPEPAAASLAKIEIRPFKVQIQDSVLQDLKRRLQNARLSAPLEGVAFEYGFNTDYLKKVVDYWQHKYDWRKEEAKLNAFPQFLAKIEGIDVHYLHVKPNVQDKKVKVLPLLMVHGWPGSVVEFYKIIPLLTTPVSGVAFEVICPSIPGYGFSEAPHHPGFAAADAARSFTKLMESLGHQRFYVQGGDWGSLIANTLSILYPEKVLGYHTNMATFKQDLCTLLKYVAGCLMPSLLHEQKFSYNVYPPREFLSFLIAELGYMHIQATKPDTVGASLGDSPAGLAAYILEKFSTWTDRENMGVKDGALSQKFSLDELLTNVMVYWVTNTITSSARFYKENLKPEYTALGFDSLPVLVPSGTAVVPNELFTMPRALLSHKYRQLLTFNHLERGGHFVAMEEPQLLADDIRTFVSAAEQHWQDEEKKKNEKKKEL